MFATVIRSISRRISYISDRFERLIIKAVLALLGIGRVADPAFNGLERAASAFCLWLAVIPSPNTLLPKLGSYAQKIIKRLERKRVYYTAAGVLFLSGFCWQLLSPVESKTKSNAVLLFVILTLILVSAYALFSSRLRPVVAMFQAWRKVTGMITAIPIVFLLVFVAFLFAALPSNLPAKYFTYFGRFAILVAIGLNVLPYLTVPFVTSGVLSQILGRRVHFYANIGLKRIGGLCVAVFLIALTVFAFRVLATIQLPLFKISPLARQMIIIVQYIFQALTAFIIPALLKVKVQPLRKAFGISLGSIVALAVAIAILNLPAFIAAVLFSVLKSAAPYGGAAWWAFNIMDAAWQAIVALVLNIALCLMFVWQMERRYHDR